jgi:integrase
MIAVCSDTGLRPIEVGRASGDWFDLENKLMVVPADESTKNRENWQCWLSQKSTNAVANWLKERSNYPKYQGEDGMWLTRNGNQYKARALNKKLDKLIEVAGIDSNSRKLSFYSFRHGAATAWIDREGLSRAKEQLRDKSIKTTEKYKREGGTRSSGKDSFW